MGKEQELDEYGNRRWVKIRNYSKSDAALTLRTRRYGITVGMYKIMILKQGNSCPGCKRRFDGLIGEHIDHCHKTGEVRGILCRSCNHALGFLKDNIETINRLGEYLKQYKQ